MCDHCNKKSIGATSDRETSTAVWARHHPGDLQTCQTT
ncbi:hypothetical protein FOFC_17543 [Fusarium oxysporum]|nr:hypothetical protein FOFC_17543 [Fusarium oxysporum]